MTVKTMDVFSCDVCKTTDTNPEGSYEVPLEWLTVRITRLADPAGSPTAHICPSCKYESITEIYDKIF
jgi:hypothetical protein